MELVHEEETKARRRESPPPAAGATPSAASAAALASAPSVSVVAERTSVGTAAEVVKSVTVEPRREKPERPSVRLGPFSISTVTLCRSAKAPSARLDESPEATDVEVAAGGGGEQKSSARRGARRRTHST